VRRPPVDLNRNVALRCTHRQTAAPRRVKVPGNAAPALAGVICSHNHVELSDVLGIGDQIATMRPCAIVKSNTTRGCPSEIQTSPGAPFTSVGCAARARPLKVSATAATPRTSAACACEDGRAVRANSNIGVELGEQRIEVAAARRGKKGIDDFSLTDAVVVGCRPGSVYATSCAAGQLSPRHVVV